MSRRPPSRFWSLIGLPLALFSAMPSVQWCSGPWVPLTQEQFAACLASEFTGCTASVACSLPSCTEGAATRQDDAGTACESAASNESVSCPPPLACEVDALVQEAGSCEEASACPQDARGASSGATADADRGPDSAAPTPARAFCVGNPAGGFGLKPLPDDDTRPDASFVAAAATNLARPPLDRGRPIASPFARPGPAPRHPTAPIRGPPSA